MMHDMAGMIGDILLISRVVVVLALGQPRLDALEGLAHANKLVVRFLRIVPRA